MFVVISVIRENRAEEIHQVYRLLVESKIDTYNLTFHRQ